MRPSRSLGFNLLGLWLVISGLVALLPLGFPGIGMLLALLAVISGLLILAGR